MDNSKKKENSQKQFAIKIYQTQESFILEASQNELPNIKTRLIIKRDLRIEEIDSSSMNIEGLCKMKNLQLANQTPYQVYAVLGIQQIMNQQFLVIVKECTEIVRINKRPIYLIQKIDFIPFGLIQEQNKTDQNVNKSEIKIFKEHIQEIFEDCHYFSYEYKLTLSQQRISQSKDYYTKDFMWNYNLSKDFFNQQVNPYWICQTIQGYIGQKLTKYHISDKDPFQFILITRRSIYRSGTRCNHRGIDLDGYTANFVETEILFIYKDILISQTQIRGSAPILWEQKGMKQKIRVLGSQDISKEAFLKHFKLLNEMYHGKITSITLMSDKKEGELIITNTMRKHYEELILDGLLSKNKVEVLYYDLKKELKGGKTQNLNPYLEEKLRNNFFSSGYFMKNMESNQVMNLQKGVFRTNCKSSLDRTNLFQIKLGCFFVEQAIQMINNYNLGKKQKFQNYNDVYENALSLVDTNPSQYPFINEYKQHFSESGNAISKIYANTDALTEHVITNGNKLFGKIKAGFSSLKRLYSARFTDSEKHKAIDIILGNDFGSQHQNSGYNEQIQESLRQKEQEYTKVQNLNIYAITWNVQAIDIQNYVPNKEMFKWEGMEVPDIICLSLQEMIDEQKSALPLRRIQWEQKIQNTFQSLKLEYVMIDCHDYSGIIQMIYTKETLKEKIRKVEHDSIKLHTFKTKGAVIQRFEIMNNELCFVNTHLSSGTGIGNENKRYEEIEEIHQESFQSEGISKFQRKKIIQNDFVFLMGDLNFRVNQPYETAQQQVIKIQEMKKQIHKDKGDDQNLDEQQIEQLKQEYKQQFKNYLNLDEFKQNKNRKWYELYKEGNIEFFPTYKFNQDDYDKNYKKPPSWCDRIFVYSKNYKKGNEKKNFQYLSYDSIKLNDSDHKPVSAYIQLKIKVEDQKKKDETKNGIIQDLLHIQIDQNKMNNDEQIKNSLLQNYSQNTVLYNEPMIEKQVQKNNDQNYEQNNQNQNKLVNSFQQESDLLDLQNQKIQNLKEKLNVDQNCIIQEEESAIEESNVKSNNDLPEFESNDNYNDIDVQIDDNLILKNDLNCENQTNDNNNQNDEINNKIQEEFQDQNQNIQQIQDKIEENQQQLQQTIDQNTDIVDKIIQE